MDDTPGRPEGPHEGPQSPERPAPPTASQPPRHPPTDAPEGRRQQLGGPWPPGPQAPPEDPLLRLYRQVWPGAPDAAPVVLLLTAAIAALLGAWLLPFSPHGLGAFVVAMAVAGATLAKVWRRTGTYERVLWGGTVLLLAVLLVRDAGWLVGLCLLGAYGLASYALVGGRSWSAAVFAGLTPPVAAVRMLPWAARGISRAGHGNRQLLWPVLRTTLIAVVLLAVFGGLFASADPAFATLASNLLPQVSLGPLVARAFVFCAIAVLALAAGYIATRPPDYDQLAAPAARAARRLEWAVPLVALDALFLSFVAVQVTVLFGGHQRVLQTSGLTYAEYVHQGFAQLVAVTLLTLPVVGVAWWKRPRTGRLDAATVRAVLGVLCALVLVIAASALWRMQLYVDAYGLSRLRVLAVTFELWLAGVFVLMMLAGLLRGGWLPRAVVASAAAALIGLTALNPDGLIAARNVARFEATGKIDMTYLRGLSADAAPALNRLPEPQRSCALQEIARRLGHSAPWHALNISRVRAERILARDPVAAEPTCPWEQHQAGAPAGSRRGGHRVILPRQPSRPADGRPFDRHSTPHQGR